MLTNNTWTTAWKPQWLQDNSDGSDCITAGLSRLLPTGSHYVYFPFHLGTSRCMFVEADPVKWGARPASSWSQDGSTAPSLQLKGTRENPGRLYNKYRQHRVFSVLVKKSLFRIHCVYFRLDLCLYIVWKGSLKSHFKKWLGWGGGRWGGGYLANIIPIATFDLILAKASFFCLKATVTNPKGSVEKLSPKKSRGDALIVLRGAASIQPPSLVFCLMN